MGTYAVVNNTTGLVESVVMWDGSDDWSAPEGYMTVESEAAAIGWSYADGVFAAPAAAPTPTPTPAEILSLNTAVYDQLYAAASQAMTPLLVSLQLGDATDAETASAKAWQAYCRSLKLVDLTVSAPAWPSEPS